MLRISGVALKSESRPWEMDGKTGTSHKTSVLVDNQDVVWVKFANPADQPRSGDAVDWSVSLNFGKLEFIESWAVKEARKAPAQKAGTGS